MSAARPPGGGERQYTLDEAAPATLLPLSNGLDAMTGQEVRTAFYSLPIPSDDGRDTLVLLPGNFTAFSTSNDYATARRWYEDAGLQAPPATRDGIAWVPPAPYYMPADPAIGMPCFYDSEAMVVWPMAPARDPAIRQHLPTYEGRSPHFFLGPPMTPFPPSAELEAEVESFYPRGMSHVREYQEGVAAGLEAGALPIRRGDDGQQEAASGEAASGVSQLDTRPSTRPAASMPPASAITAAEQSVSTPTRDGNGASTVSAAGAATGGVQRSSSALGAAARSMWGGGSRHSAAARPARAAAQGRTLASSSAAAPVPSATMPSTPATSAAGPQQQRRQQQPGARQSSPRPQQQQPAPSFDNLQRATLLDDDESMLFDMMSNVTPTTYYSLPMTAADGRQTIVVMPGESAPLVPREREYGAGEEPYMPYDPIYLPAFANPYNTPCLWDHITGIIWPLLSLTSPNAPTLSARQRTRNPHLVTGHPIFDEGDPREDWLGGGTTPGNVRSAAELRRDNLARIKRFVDELDTADAELRLRMARLGIGEVGDDATGEGRPGCAVCIETFDIDDKPEWAVGPEAHDQRVVITPCGGFHLFHQICLRQSLEAVESWRQWACPMCRTSLRDAAAKRVEEAEGMSRAGVASANGTGQKTTQKSLREEIRRREKERGYLCDYPACYPTYDAEPPTTARISEVKDDGQDDGQDAVARLEAELDRRLITLKPCNHAVHRECLTTVLRVEDRHALEIEAEDSEEDQEEEEDAEDEISSGVASAGLDDDEKGKSPGRSTSLAVHEVGRWVKCPIDKADVWAMIPVVKKGRSTTRVKQDETGSSSWASSRKDEGVVVVDKAEE